MKDSKGLKYIQTYVKRNIRLALICAVICFVPLFITSLVYDILWYDMLCNGGNICEMRMFQTGGHPFDLASQNRVATFVNTRGIQLTDVPIAYIEALQFWRRYEQSI